MAEPATARRVTQPQRAVGCTASPQMRLLYIVVGAGKIARVPVGVLGDFLGNLTRLVRNRLTSVKWCPEMVKH